MTLAIVFPGQGSQAAGMLAALAGADAVVEATFARASAVLGYDLWALVRDGPEAELARTEVTQPAMLAAGFAVWGAWRNAGGPAPDLLAGHSLGEYTALCAAGALGFEEAVALVAARGRLMQEAVPAGIGAMAAVMGLEAAQVEALCERHAGGECVSCANYNAPGQIVVAGHAGAVERVLAAAREAGAKRAVALPVSAPFHCALMKPAADALRGHLEAASVSAPAIPVVHNCDARTRASAEEVREALYQQAYGPVRWTDCVEALAAAGTRTLVELGPAQVLTGLNKRIDRRIAARAAGDPATLQAALEAALAEVSP